MCQAYKDKCKVLRLRHKLIVYKPSCLKIAWESKTYFNIVDFNGLCEWEMIRSDQEAEIIGTVEHGFKDELVMVRSTQY